MESYLLAFGSEVKSLERAHQWDQAAIMLYEEWKKNRFDLNTLLCAGTQAWLGIIENEKEWLNPDNKEPFNFITESMLKEILNEVAEWGCKYYSDNPVFGIYFGYLMDVTPYFFETGRQAQRTGQEMIQRAFLNEKKNPIVNAIYFRTTGESEKANQACEDIWELYTREQWGDSAVQNYFFRILGGNTVADNA